MDLNRIGFIFEEIEEKLFILSRISFPTLGILTYENVKHSMEALLELFQWSIHLKRRQTC